MMAIMTFACALLIEPLPAKREGGKRTITAKPERVLVRKERRPEPALPKPQPPETPGDSSAHNQTERWGADIEWPQEWSKPVAKDETSKPSN